MARGEEKNTIGTWIESRVQDTAYLTGLGTGAAVGLHLPALAGSSSITGPEGVAVTIGALGSIAGGAVAGSKLSSQLEGRIADRIDDLKPASLQDEELYLDEGDPFELEIDKKEVRGLEDSRKEQIRRETNKDNFKKLDLYDLESQDQVGEWVEEMVYGDINGLQSQFKTNVRYKGDFKSGYVDRNEEVFVQAPRKGDTFEEAMKIVKTWKENKETLDQADQYLEQVLSEEGTKTVSEGPLDVEIDYDFLRENEETLRREVQGGIMTPSENYDIVVTSHEDEPLPVLVGDFNTEMLEGRQNIRDLKNNGNIQERKQVLGMYMDALIVEEEFEGHLGDFWYTEGYGREKTKNTFYDPETDSVGVTDIGEYRSQEPEEMPQISIEKRYG